MANGEMTRREALSSVGNFQAYMVDHMARQETETQNLKAEVAEVKLRLNEIQTPGTAKWCMMQDGEIERLESKVDKFVMAVFGAALTALASIGVVLVERFHG